MAKLKVRRRGRGEDPPGGVSRVLNAPTRAGRKPCRCWRPPNIFGPGRPARNRMRTGRIGHVEPTRRMRTPKIVIPGPAKALR